MTKEQGILDHVQRLGVRSSASSVRNGIGCVMVRPSAPAVFRLLVATIPS